MLSFKHQSYGQGSETTKKVIQYNGNFNLDKNKEFIDINLFYNKLNIQRLANN